MASDWMIVVTVGGCTFGFLIFVHLVAISKIGSSTRWLSFYVLLLTVSLAEYIFPETSLAALIAGCAAWLFGPVLHLYVCLRIGLITKITRREAMHFFPFLAYTLLLAVSFLLPPGSKDREMQDLIGFFLYEALFFQIFLYLLLSGRLMLFHNRLTRSEVESMRWAFLKVLVYSSMLLFVTSWLGTHIFILAGMEISLTFKAAIQVLVCVLLFVIALLNTESMYAKKLIRVTW